MNKNRIEAFSDGVIAIIITIMVLELDIAPLQNGISPSMVWNAIFQLLPKLLAYGLSFLVVAIMWLNHHTLFDEIPHSDTALIWYNNLLLFTMSLIPLPTAFLSEHPLLYQAVMLYGFIMALNALAFLLLRRYAEVHAQLIPYHSNIHRSNIITVGLYLAAIPLSLISVYLSFIIFIGIPAWYFLPNKFYNQTKTL